MKYTGSCHCQKVKFTCELELKTPIVCNCSYHSMNNATVHVADSIIIQEGASDLTCYTFNTMKGNHHFCKHCGVYIYGPTPTLEKHTVNLRTLKDCDWQKLDVYNFDGKAL